MKAVTYLLLKIIDGVSLKLLPVEQGVVDNAGEIIDENDPTVAFIKNKKLICVP